MRKLYSFILVQACLSLAGYIVQAQDSTHTQSKVTIKSYFKDGKTNIEKSDSIEISGEEDITRMLDSVLNGIGNLSSHMQKFFFNDGDNITFDNFPDLDSFMKQLPFFNGNDVIAPPMRPFLGIVFEDHLDENEEKTGEGVNILRVIKGSGAEEAGIQPNDVLLKLDGQKVIDMHSIMSILEKKKVGEEILLTYDREGKTIDTKAILKGKPIEGEQPRSAFSGPVPPLPPLPPSFPKCEKIIIQKSGPRLGVNIIDLDQEARESLKIKKGGGVLVTKVIPGSTADKMGLKINDVITKVNGKDIALSTDLKFILNDFKVGDQIEIAYKRYGKSKKTSAILNEYARIGDEQIPMNIIEFGKNLSPEEIMRQLEMIEKQFQAPGEK
jgi:membrane-associated protease RseP (regulator of RpoE activity)